MVRLEALRAIRTLSARAPDAPLNVCDASMSAASDRDPHVVLTALDQLADCTSAEAVALLDRTANDLPPAGSSRGWHRAAHAIVALASASPERGAAALRQIAGSSIWQLRMYAARAAAILKDRATLELLARDGDDNVKEAAIEGLAAVSGHSADAVYVEALATGRYQVLRAAAAALAGTSCAGCRARAPGGAQPARAGRPRQLARRADGNCRRRFGGSVRRPIAAPAAIADRAPRHDRR